MSALRPAALAGQWYPRSKEACEAFFEGVPASELDPSGAHGVVIPHAGWVYSGAVAFSALKLLHAARPDADLVVLFAGHMARDDTPRLFVEGGFETPFGPIAVPEPLAQDLAMAFGEADLESPEEFYEDNAVEVALPMIKRLWPDAPLCVIGPPPTSAAISIGKEAVKLARVHRFQRPVLIGSTDLTHYGPNYDFQPKGAGRRGLDWVKSTNDPAVIAPMLKLDAADVLWVAERNHNACCAGAAAAAIAGAKALGDGRGQLVRYTTSHDQKDSGREPTSFVGYAGVLI